MNGTATFDSNNLSTYDPVTHTGIVINSINHTNTPNQNTPIFVIADANRSAISSITNDSKNITIAGSIIATTQAALDDLIDTFKGYFNGKNKVLAIPYGSGTRLYTATKNAISMTRQNTALFANFEVSFVCTDPFGRDSVITSIANNQNYTSATLTVTPTIGGNAPVQYPIITITIDALTGTGDYVQITNNNNSQQMLLYGFALTAGTVIVIDAFKRTVTINGTEVDYRGTFLELAPGAQSITYTDGFTTRTVDIVIGYYKRWQ